MEDGDKKLRKITVKNDLGRRELRAQQEQLNPTGYIGYADR